MGKETKLTKCDKRCIDCQESGNGKGNGGDTKIKLRCFKLHSGWWMHNVINTSFDCEYFKPLIDIGERMEVTYPIDELKKLEK